MYHRIKLVQDMLSFRMKGVELDNGDMYLDGDKADSFGRDERLNVNVIFFSSRRRHTRCSRDWSSDVCSSDLDTSYVLGASSMLSQSGAEADVASFSPSGDTGTVVSKRDWSIEFATGQASFTPEGERKMYEIKDDLAIAGALFVTLNGHTDNMGTHDGNMDLAMRRAQAVRDWLQRKAPANFPDNRFRIQEIGRAHV